MRPLVLLISAVIGVAQTSRAQQQAVQISGAPIELDVTHSPVLVTPREVIRSADGGIYDSMVQVQLSVEIGVDGHVEYAEPIGRAGGYFQKAKPFYEQAKNLELHRVFQPVLNGSGTAVRAHFTDYVEVLPPERWLDHPVPFPEQVDLSTFSIMLKRQSGMISCRTNSGYTVTITGAGDVSWQTEGGMIGEEAPPGHTTISHEAVQELVEQIRASHMLDARDKYASSWNDGNTSTLTLNVNGVHKQVVDYLGPYVGMPSSISQLEETVDRAAGTDKLAHCK